MIAQSLTWALAITALAAAPIANAAAPCWEPPEIGAARVQEFEAMMMSVSIRCRSSVGELPAQFERFRDNHRQRLESAFRTLTEHFGAARSRQGKLDLDHFLIQQSNRFGGGRSDGPTCRGFAAVLAELAVPASIGDTLDSFALAMVRDPYLDGPRCPTRPGSQAITRGFSGSGPAGR